MSRVLFAIVPTSFGGRSPERSMTVAPCYDGQNTCCFTETCQPLRTKINRFSEKAKQHYNPRRPAPTTEGVSRSLRHVARDAMDAPLTAKRAAEARTVKPCGPGTSTLVSTPGSSPGGRGLKSPIPRGEHGVSRQTSRRECRIVRLTCSDYACGPPTLFCPRGCGCGQRPAFPAPSAFQRDTLRLRSSSFGATSAELGRIPAARTRSRVKKFHCRPGQASALRRGSAVK